MTSSFASPQKSSPSFPELEDADPMAMDDEETDSSLLFLSMKMQDQQSEWTDKLNTSIRSLSTPIKTFSDTVNSNNNWNTGDSGDENDVNKENGLDSSMTDFDTQALRLIVACKQETQNDSTSSTDKKIHWTSHQVDTLLNLVEQRLDEFKKRSIHIQLWQEIGREMAAEFPQVTAKHCCNKWKNLRRDVRLSLDNPQKAIRNAGILERMNGLVSEIYPNDVEKSGGFSRLAIASPIHKKKTVVLKKEKSATIRHPKLTNKQIARDQQSKNTVKKTNESQNDSEVEPLSILDSANTTDLPLQSLLSVAANSLMHDLQQHQMQRVQSAATSAHSPQSTSPGQVAQTQLLSGLLPNNTLQSLMMNHNLLLNTPLLTNLLAINANPTAAALPTSEATSVPHPPLPINTLLLPQDLSMRTEDMASDPLSVSQNIPVGISNGLGTLGSQQLNLQQSQDLVILLKSFHSEETQHTKVIEQMATMAMDLKLAAQKRLSALDDLLLAFSGNNSHN